MRTRRVIPTAAALTLAAALSAGAAPAPAAAPSFNPPVKLTIDKYTGGYEPGLLVDRYGNIVVTAHKQNHSLVVSPDSRSATGVRSQSWVWTSSDGGRHFHDMPGLTPLQEQNLEFGDEGDLATDDSSHIYFVDTNVGDVTFTRWTAKGPGKLSMDFTRPLLPAGEEVDDRPWVIAHGNGHVFYLGNEGDKGTYPLGQGRAGNGNGAGRYTVYASSDGGQTFDSVGYTLKDSGWCRPATDHQPDVQHRVIVLCTNDGNGDVVDQTVGEPGPGPALYYAYVSNNDGKTFSRYTAGRYNKDDPWSTWPAAAIGPDGTIYGLYVNDDTDKDGNVVRSHLMLLRSRDGGRSWTTREITPQRGLIRYSWLDVAPDGTVGIAYYYRPNTNSDWHVYAGTSPRGGGHFAITSVDPKRPVASKDFSEPFGDFFEVAFSPNDKLNVVWTYQNTDLVLEGLNTDIYFARQR